MRVAGQEFIRLPETTTADGGVGNVGAAEHHNGRTDILLALDQLRLEGVPPEGGPPERIPAEKFKILVGSPVGS